MILTDAVKNFAGQLTKVFDMEEPEGEPETIMPYSNATDKNLALAAESNSNKNTELKVVSHPTFKGGYDVMICEPNSYDKSVELVKLLK